MIEHLGAVAAVRDRIARRAGDKRLVVVPGLADDLHAIGEAFSSLELTSKTLARIYLAKHYGYHLSTPEYQFLATLAGDVGTYHERFSAPHVPERG